MAPSEHTGVTMRFVTVRDFRTGPANIWKDLPEEQEMIITNNGKPVALLLPISDVDLEATLRAVRRSRAQAAVEAMQLGSVQKGLSQLTPSEIENEIQLAREVR